jgi:hypothetical protein
MRRAYLLIVTAVTEGGTGLVLLILPGVLVELLLGVGQPSAEATLIARFAGAALIAIGITSWLARNDGGSPSQLGLLAGVLVYDVAAAALLAYAGLVLGMVSVALWFVVLIHAGLALWALLCLRGGSSGERDGLAEKQKSG